MSQYVDVKYDHYEAKHTDHSGEIEALRAKVAEIMAQYPDTSVLPDEERLRVRMQSSHLMCAAALLEVHDDTGISLDNWVGPRELVEDSLEFLGFPDGTFLENHV